MEFSWRDLKVAFLGRVFEGITDCQYKKEEDKKPVYGRGSKTKSIQRGNQKCSGDLTLKQSEVEAMLLAAKATNPLADLLDLVFDIQVQYVAEGTTDIVKDKILEAQFTSIPKGMKQGDASMEIKLSFVAVDILYGI
ncbi:MAG: hypothetical protein NTZ59_11610 [Bacteroidetes bacterium]|jgi:hypothetical protein|nr:hypothetical protein [Bacteroidota bacterium]